MYNFIESTRENYHFFEYDVPFFSIEQITHSIEDYFLNNGATKVKLPDKRIIDDGESLVYKIIVGNQEFWLVVYYYNPAQKLVVLIPESLEKRYKYINEYAILPYIRKYKGAHSKSSNSTSIKNDQYRIAIDYLEISKDTKNSSIIDKKVHSVETITHLSNSFDKVIGSSEEITIPKGVVVKVKRSRTIEHEVSIEWDNKTLIDFSVGIKEIISTKISTDIGNSHMENFRRSQTNEYEVELDGNVSNNYKLIWYDVWLIGSAEVKNEKNSTSILPFKLRSQTVLEVVPIL
ncbi:MAG: hypothetical protein VB013_11695 [Anaerolineaceae bacterium]|nr:hypothetical protein [Anaerolineaceae bacterium]